MPSYHPLLSLTLIALLPASALALEARVETRNGVPIMVVNGKPMPPFIFLHTAGAGATPLVCHVTPQWQQFTYTFVAPCDDDNVAVHVRNCTPAGDWWVDDVMMIEGTLAKPLSPNLLDGGDFEGAELPKGWTYFLNNSTGADVKFSLDTDNPHSGKSCLRVHIVKAGTISYQIHIYHPTRLQKGKTYTVSLWLRASDNRDIETQAIHQAPPWTIYGGNDTPSDELLALGRDRGLHIGTMPMDLPWAKPGEQPDYAGVDAQVEHIVRIDPNALIIPRIHLDAPEWWKKDHPGHIMVYDYGPRTQASPASKPWQQDAAANLRLLVRHLEARYGDHMLGYHISAQSAGEWFYDWTWEPIMPCFEEPFRAAFADWAKAKYKTVEALRAAWGPHPPAPLSAGGEGERQPERFADVTFETIRVPTLAERTAGKLGAFRDPKAQRFEIDFAEYMQECLCDDLLAFAKLVKEETGRRKLVVSFYGYLYDVSGFAYGGAVSGHLRMRKALDSPDVDIFCSPISYNDRQAGGCGPFMSAVDTVMAHGKLWVNEDDARTHLAPVDAGYGRTSTMEETLGVYERNFGHQFERHCGTWWMDFGTGWMADKTIFDTFAKERDIWAAQASRVTQAPRVAQASRLRGSSGQPSRRAVPGPQPFRPQVAVITDEDSFLYLRNSNEITVETVSQMRLQVNRMGCPIGHYLMADLCEGRVPDSARMYVFLNAYRVTEAQRQQIRARIARDSKMTVWLYAPGFVKEDAQAANIGDLIGFEVRQADAPAAAVSLLDTRPAWLSKLPQGYRFGPDRKPTPLFAVTAGQAGVLPLGAYAGTGETAFAMKRMPGWTSVFCGGLQLSAPVLRELARLAGVHVYCETDDVISGTEGFVSIHATSAGPKTLVLPEAATLRDLITGQTLPAAKSHTFDMKLGETRLFGVG